MKILYVHIDLNVHIDSVWPICMTAFFKAHCDTNWTCTFIFIIFVWIDVIYYRRYEIPITFVINGRLITMNLFHYCNWVRKKILNFISLPHLYSTHCYVHACIFGAFQINFGHCWIIIQKPWEKASTPMSTQYWVIYIAKSRSEA